ncbi:MAG: DinB family protein [Nitrososphaerales archaeon]
MTPSDYTRIFDYNKKILRAFFLKLSSMPWELVAKNMEASHHSMKNIFVHLLVVYDGWLYRNNEEMKKDVPWQDYKGESYYSMKEVGVFMDKVVKNVDLTLNGLTEEKLHSSVKAPWFDVSMKLSDALMQVTFEQANHIGEIIALMWQRNIEPPDMTWFDNMP